jgi:hypothetical protein
METTFYLFILHASCTFVLASAALNNKVHTVQSAVQTVNVRSRCYEGLLTMISG